MAEVRVVRAGELSADTAQTAGMTRIAAVDRKTVGSERLWVGFASVAPGIRSGAHHHGGCDSVVHVTAGRLSIRYGERLERSVEANAGDFIFVPANLVHQEINRSEADPVETLVVRSGDNIVVNVEVAEAAQ